MLAIAVAPAVIFSVADAVRRYGRVAEERREAFFSAALIDAQATRDVFVELRAVARTLALDPDVVAFREPNCSQLLGAAIAENPLFILAVAVDAEGRPRCGSRPFSPDVAFADDPLFVRMRANPAFALAVRRSGRVTGQEVVIGSAPFESEDGFRGFVSISVSAASLRFLAAQSAATPERRPFRAVVGAEGEILSSVDEAGDASSWLPAIDLSPKLGAEAVGFTAPTAAGAHRVYALSPFVSDQAWLLAASDDEALFDVAMVRALPGIISPLITLALAVGVAYFALDRLVARHVVRLSELTRAYGRGELDLKPGAVADAPEEIASLAASLATMAGNLATRQRELRAVAETNRVLLLEVFHRVRNTLQTVTSLLTLQMRRAESDAERVALDRIRARIHSLALVHEKLYESDAVDRLDLARLLADVAQAAASAREGDRREAPRLRIDLDPCVATPERATPLALFLNEAVAKAVRHAAAPEGRPEVAVMLRAPPDGSLTLTVENDADGPPGPPSRESLGARLMEGFARQLRGRLTRERVGLRHVVTLEAPAPEPAARA